MSFPATTAEQAQALLGRPEMTPFAIDGHTLTAKLVERGVQPVVREVEGRMKWVEEPAFEVHFEGGKWGPHTLRCSVSSPERILAHWSGYKTAHIQDLERRQGLRSAPAGQVLPKHRWEPKVGDRVYFSRGMFGMWRGRIKRLYTATRGCLSYRKGTFLAEIAFTGANGRPYTYRSVQVKSITHLGMKPYLPEEA